MKRQCPAFSVGILARTWFVIALLLAAVPSGGDAGPVRERIIYTALRPANTNIYLFDAPGKAPRRLTDHPALDYNPVFSPDGRWVVFCSERKGNPDLYALDLQNPGTTRSRSSRSSIPSPMETSMHFAWKTDGSYV